MNRQDLEALRNMVSQAHLIVSTEPLIAGGIERARELLATAEKLADFLLRDGTFSELMTSAGLYRRSPSSGWPYTLMCIA